ncbi:MAG: hypothetical protein ACI9NT_002760, partial [Bacteroidia bacterium]
MKSFQGLFYAISRYLLPVLLLSALAQQAGAYPGYLQQFDAAYPTSTTSQVSCATCHATSAGGPPWNAYGRDLIANGASVGAAGNISAALLAVQTLNSDAIAGGNLTEIQADTQPGWCDSQTSGCTNQTYNKDGSNAGPGTPPASLTLDDGSVTAPEPNILVLPSVVDFGPVLIGQSKTQLVNVINTGALDLTLEGLISGPDFSIASPPAVVLTSGESSNVLVEYAPGVEETDNGVLTLNSNDPDSPAVNVDLTGSGVFVLPEPEGECPIGTRLIDPIPASIPAGAISVDFETVADGFVNPLLGIAPTGDSDRLFVLDQPGQIWAVDLENGGKSIFLDLSSRLVSLGLFGLNYDERGLLGAAFAPDYFSSGLLYTYQSEPPLTVADFSTMPTGIAADHQSVIVEWRVTAPMSPVAVANPASARVIMKVDQPQFNHNGGSLVFGPDGMLYITIGDGG